MSGQRMKLAPGRYTLQVSEGEGPAGVQRGNGSDVRVEIDGGRVEFTVAAREEVYYWWRGPRQRRGVRLLGVQRASGRAREPVAPATG